jgi:hypothetical protein
MRVFALLDKTRHIWKPATLEEIKSNIDRLTIIEN